MPLWFLSSYKCRTDISYHSFDINSTFFRSKMKRAFKLHKKFNIFSYWIPFGVCWRSANIPLGECLTSSEPPAAKFQVDFRKGENFFLMLGKILCVRNHYTFSISAKFNLQDLHTVSSAENVCPHTGHLNSFPSVIGNLSGYFKPRTKKTLSPSS